MGLSYLTKMNASLTDLVTDFRIAHVICRGGGVSIDDHAAADVVESRHDGCGRDCLIHGKSQTNRTSNTIGEADLPCAIPATTRTYAVEYEADFPHAVLPCPSPDPGHSQATVDFFPGHVG